MIHLAISCEQIICLVFDSDEMTGMMSFFLSFFFFFF